MKNKISLAFIIYLMQNTFVLADTEIFNPWVTSSPGSNAAFFVEIHNKDRTPNQLVEVQTSIAPHLEFHDHVDIGNGIMHMAKIDAIKIPPHGYMILKPGGHHIMLRGLPGPLQPGQTVNFTLRFQDGEIIKGVAPVRNIGSFN